MAKAPYDLVFATILAPPLVALAQDIKGALKPGGVAILSGLLRTQERRIVAAYVSRGFRLERRIHRDAWAALGAAPRLADRRLAEPRSTEPARYLCADRSDRAEAVKEVTTMSNDGDYVERTVEAPTTIRREEVHVVRSSSNAGWWVAAVVAIVAIIGVVFLLNSNNQNAVDLQAARDQGAAQAQVDNATTNAQMAASQAAQSAQAAAQSTTQAGVNAAQAATDRAASAADAAARDASATAPQPPPQQ